MANMYITFLFMNHTGIFPMTLSTKTPYNACMSIDDVNIEEKYV